MPLLIENPAPPVGPDFYLHCRTKAAPSPRHFLSSVFAGLIKLSLTLAEAENTTHPCEKKGELPKPFVSQSVAQLMSRRHADLLTMTSPNTIEKIACTLACKTYKANPLCCLW